MEFPQHLDEIGGGARREPVVLQAIYIEGIEQAEGIEEVG